MSRLVRRRHVSVREDLYASAQQLADARGVSMSVVTELALTELLESQGVKPPSPTCKDRVLLEQRHGRIREGKRCESCFGTGVAPPPEEPPP